MERIKDYLLLEEELIQNQNRLKPQEEREEVRICISQKVEENKESRMYKNRFDESASIPLSFLMRN